MGEASSAATAVPAKIELDTRLGEHPAGEGARLVEVIIGSGSRSSRHTWPGGRYLERDQAAPGGAALLPDLPH